MAAAALCVIGGGAALAHAGTDGAARPSAHQGADGRTGHAEHESVILAWGWLDKPREHVL
jgi:hypothetical protein